MLTPFSSLTSNTILTLKEALSFSDQPGVSLGWDNSSRLIFTHFLIQGLVVWPSELFMYGWCSSSSLFSTSSFLQGSRLSPPLLWGLLQRGSRAERRPCSAHKTLNSVQETEAESHPSRHRRTGAAL